MGKRGPKQQPKRVLENRGTARRRLNRQAERQLPPPEHPFSEWDELARQVERSTDWDTVIRGIPAFDPLAKIKTTDNHFDAVRAARAIAFYEYFLVHVQGEKAGQPFTLEPWERSIIANLWGWRDNDTDLRWIREAFIFVPRGNGKSAFASGMCLLSLLEQEHKGAEIYSCAGDRSQAAKVHDVAKQMLITSPSLAPLVFDDQTIGVYKSSITLNDFDFYKVVSADAKLREGGNASLVCFDELHVQKTRDLYEVMKKSAAKRRGSLFLSITTAGSDTTTICYEVYDFAKKIIRGEAEDNRFLPVIYEPNEKDDWTAPETWRKCNPNINVSIFESEMAAECARAKAIPSSEFDFKRKFLNIWTQVAERWLAMNAWDKCPSTPPDEDDLRKSPCWGGFDLGWNRDLTCFALYFPEYKACRVWTWLPDDDIEQREEYECAKYRIWARDSRNNLVLTEGIKRDDEEIYQAVMQICETYNVQKIGADKAWDVTDILKRFLASKLPFFEFVQGYISFTGPCKELETMVYDRSLNWGGNQVFRYCAESAALDQKRDAITECCKPVKGADNLKIDALIAACMAIGMAAREKGKPSVYAQRAQAKAGGVVVQQAAPVKFQSTYAQRAAARRALVTK